MYVSPATCESETVKDVKIEPLRGPALPKKQGMEVKTPKHAAENKKDHTHTHARTHLKGMIIALALGYPLAPEHRTQLGPRRVVCSSGGELVQRHACLNSLLISSLFSLYIY